MTKFERIPMPRKELAKRLHLSPITVDRWFKSDPATPRTGQIHELLRIIAVQIEIAESRTANPKRARLPLLQFGSNLIGIYQAVDYFFDRVAGPEESELYVQDAWVFKSLMGFHAGQDARTVERLASLLAKFPQLVIHYVYPAEFDGLPTEAHKTFSRMLEDPSLRPYREQIQHSNVVMSHKGNPWELFARLGLGITYCSHFILNYNDAGQARYGRVRDILVEVPCQKYSEAGKFEDSTPQYLFIELPWVFVSELWRNWKAAIDNTSQSQKVQS